MPFMRCSLLDQTGYTLLVTLSTLTLYHDHAIGSTKVYSGQAQLLQSCSYNIAEVLPRALEII